MKKLIRKIPVVVAVCFLIMVVNVNYVLSQEETDVPSCECQLMPAATILSRGATFEFEATIENNTDQNGFVHFATRVVSPSGSQTRYLIGPLAVYLNPFQIRTGDLPQYIPSYVQEGIYTYHGYVGIPGVMLFHECMFTFEVTSLVGCSNCHSLWHPVDVSQQNCSDCHTMITLHSVHDDIVDCVSCHH